MLATGQWLGETQTLFPTVYLPLAKPLAVRAGGKARTSFRFRYGSRLPSVAIEVTSLATHEDIPDLGSPS
jgi:hypothetical protein